VLYLMVAPTSNPIGVGLVAAGLLVIGLARAAARRRGRREDRPGGRAS